MAGASKKLVVFGGSGFLGSRICQAAVNRGWDVTSISRSGQPTWTSVSSSANPPAWSHRVAWERADIFRPPQWTPLLASADYVVHSMGILLEADYKGLVSGRDSPLAALKRNFSPRHTPNPLDPESTLTTNPPTEASQLTYENMNRDSAILLAKEAAKERVKVFGYISAAGGAPVLPSRYITTKREAEDIIVREFTVMRNVFFRPAFMYDSSRAFTVPLAVATTASSAAAKFLPSFVKDFMGSAAVKPLPADTVAEAVVEGLSEASVRGPVEVEQLEELANKGWRKSML